MPTSGGWDSHVHVFDASHPACHGHYRPESWSLAELSATAAPWGITHFVLVQPSVYGSDNSIMLDALRSAPGMHRGIAVIDEHTTLAQLRKMDHLGVRGIRFNLVSPVGNDSRLLHKVTPWLHALGWHVQWYAHAHQLPQILVSHNQSGLPCVLDHMGGLSLNTPNAPQDWEHLRQLAALGAWVKLSGWYRLGDSSADFSASRENIARMLDLFGQRAIWGSDAPNTAFPRQAMPSYATLVQAVSSMERHPLRSILHAASKLYR